ncbi:MULTISPECIES: hypothetical protein [Clostridium]|uniref:hypothetical protein n=1 Tax=Clostridium TaxID=1485 RepID=UPI0008250DCF|nr:MULTISPECIES: hypothetical protein [Clostridium]PJI07024.1 hypothetical protein CUB90_03725 [Clostridium sp. CT7]
MLVKGECLKSDLLQAIHDAILSSGSNWTEISSNNEQDYNIDGGGSDGWIFKSPGVGKNGQSVFFTLKGQDFTVENTYIIMVGLSENYLPNATANTNGTHTNKGTFLWAICSGSPNYDTTWLPTDTVEYFVDVLDNRILITIQKKSAVLNNYPQYMYIGYPDLATNLESTNINQFICGSNLRTKVNAYKPVWLKTSQCKSGSYNPYFATVTSAVYLNANNPTPGGEYLMWPVYLNGDDVTNPSCGLLGVLDGLYFLPATNVINGDIIKVGDSTYKVFVQQWYINNQINAYGGWAYWMNSVSASVWVMKIS